MERKEEWEFTLGVLNMTYVSFMYASYLEGVLSPEQHTRVTEISQVWLLSLKYNQLGHGGGDTSSSSVW